MQTKHIPNKTKSYRSISTLLHGHYNEDLDFNLTKEKKNGILYVQPNLADHLIIVLKIRLNPPGSINWIENQLRY